MSNMSSASRAPMGQITNDFHCRKYQTTFFYYNTNHSIRLEETSKLYKRNRYPINLVFFSVIDAMFDVIDLFIVGRGCQSQPEYLSFPDQYET